MIRKNFLVTLAIYCSLSLYLFGTDKLKHSLTSILKHKEDTKLVDLSGLDINGKPKPLQPVGINSRPSNTIVALANGKKLKKKVLDDYLSKVTKGKIKDFDLLPPKQKKVLVQQYYLPKYIGALALQEIPKKDRLEVYQALWMRKKADSINISSSEIKDVYDNMVLGMKQRNPNAIVPPFENIKDRLKLQILDEKVTNYVLSNANVEVSEPNPMQIAGTINGDFVSVDEVEPIVKQLSHGKASWQRLHQRDKQQVLEMIATKKLMPSVAMKELSYQDKINAISNIWMQKKISSIDIKEKDIKKAYKKFVKHYKKGKKPSYDEVKNDIKMQLARDKYMKKLMKQIKVKLK